MAGWIKIYREIIHHWIWQNPAYLKAWITILLIVNHDEIKVLIEGELIVCGRGQSLNSLKSWAKLFGNGWTIQRVRTFFELLKSDQMIITEGLRKTTRLTVCNYDLYQNEQQGDNRETTSREQGDNKEITSNKNDKKDKKEKNDKNEDSEIKISAPIKNDFINDVIREFKKAYEEANELPYAILNKGKERSAAGKLLKEFKAQHPDFDSVQTIESLSKYFDKVVNINDTWLRANMSLSMLMSRFNEINNTLRNGKHTSNQGGTDKEFFAVLSKHTS